MNFNLKIQKISLLVEPDLGVFMSLVGRNANLEPSLNRRKNRWMAELEALPVRVELDLSPIVLKMGQKTAMTILVSCFKNYFSVKIFIILLKSYIFDDS